jgi:intracellular sulfur oxidation DsrE/DsrF family protein
VVTLNHLATNYRDTYLVDVPLQAVADHPPIRATRVVVRLKNVPDEPRDKAVEVLVRVTGEKLVQTPGGWVSDGGGDVRVYGLAEEPVRYGLCREAVLDSMRRHGIDPAHLADFAFQDEWDVHKQRIEVGAVNLGGAVSRYLATPPGEADVEDDRWQ